MVKLTRTSTVAASLDILLKGQLAYLNQYYEVVAVSGPDSHLQAVTEREKVRTISIAMNRNISLLKDFHSLIKLFLLFKRENPQIVHSITPKAGLLSMMAGKMAGVPVRMHTFTGLIFPSKSGSMQKLLIMMDKLLCACATHIYPEGNGVKDDLIKYKITSKPLKVLANGNVNGIDLDYFNPDKFSENQLGDLKNRLKIDCKDFVFIFVGRLVKDKGINELVAAFSKVEIPNIKLLLVGPLEEDLDPLLPEVLMEIHKNEKIIQVGFQQDVRPYFAVAHALVFPSYREGFPNVVMQAGAMHLPSIVTDINGCNEIIVNEQNGLVIPVKDDNAILESMNRLVKDAQLYSYMKQNSRKMIADRYEQSVVWKAVLEEYQNVLK
ncbi:glycosyl transferase family 1 [Chryseobacterium sp. Leaf180]|nr:glycosyl transferase family 1 [Chryseobacterium sp. Leaf180]